MGSPGLPALSRQSGLMREMQIIANNIANAATTGFRQEGVIFSEFVRRAEAGQPALSMGAARVRETSLAQGALEPTGGPFDLAIEGRGFFMVETPEGPRLTRAGNFLPNAEGDLVTPGGYRVLDAGGAPIFIPPDAGQVRVSEDGTIAAQGRVLGQIGVFEAEAPSQLVRQDGVLFRTSGDPVPVESPRVLQGFLEKSNVDAILQMARMIEVQRAYELGQSFLDAEDQRIRKAVDAMLK